jgi:hypothetical protein
VGDLDRINPGPWLVESGDEGTFVTHGGRNGIVVAKVYGLRGNENAALIASAPDIAREHGELLEALRRLRAHVNALSHDERGDYIHSEKTDAASVEDAFCAGLISRIDARTKGVDR